MEGSFFWWCTIRWLGVHVGMGGWPDRSLISRVLHQGGTSTSQVPSWGLKRAARKRDGLLFVASPGGRFPQAQPGSRKVSKGLG